MGEITPAGPAGTLGPGARAGLTGELWAAAQDIYDAIVTHPFLDGMTAGTLPRNAFAHYVVQDSHYLREYARALRLLAAKAPDVSTAAMFAAHAAGAVAVERALHRDFLTELGGSSAPVAPTTQAYTDFLLAAALGGSYAEALAAVLPCYWIYAEVGTALIACSSPDPLYARWIETYGGEEFARVVRDVLGATDRLGADVSPGERARMRGKFTTAARYEWMFWDAAYRLERWPV